jgi:aryl carrier-like protein
VIEFLGRADNQIKLRGYRIELGEIENALRRQSGVLDCVVVVREDIRNSRQLVAYMVRQVDAPLQPEVAALIARLKETLPDYMVPSVIVVLRALPRTPNGKVDRKALPAPNRSAAKSENNFVAPETQLEKKVAAIWGELLGLERISVKDNFFDLGGHSLLGLRLVNQLRETLGAQVAFTIVFEAPTVAEMAALLEKNCAAAPGNAGASESIPIVPVNREARRLRRP